MFWPTDFDSNQKNIKIYNFTKFSSQSCKKYYIKKRILFKNEQSCEIDEIDLLEACTLQSYPEKVL